MDNLTIQIGHDESLMNLRTARQLISGLAQVSFNGEIIPMLEGGPDANIYSVKVSARNGRDLEMLAAILNFFKVNWYILPSPAEELPGEEAEELPVVHDLFSLVGPLSHN